MSRTPRYQGLAETLKARIAAGVYGVGDLLPTELEICRDESVSRHTARDALRILINAGLVERRQGAGTRVISDRPPRAFVQPLGGPAELMQYARDAKLVVGRVVRRALRTSEAERLRVDFAGTWLIVEGLRCAPTGEILASTTLYVPEIYAEIENDLGSWAGSVQELIAERWGIHPSRIEQEIAAETLTAGPAALIKTDPGSAALRTLRRYYDGDRLIVASDSLHPAGRFVYQMTYRREG